MSGSEPDRFNRRSWGRSLNSRKSADFITATHGGQPEDSFSEGSAVFSDLESTTIRRDSGPVGSGLFPCWHCYQTWSTRLFCYLLDPGGPPVNKPLFDVDRVFGRDRKPGDIFLVMFPIGERTVREKLGDVLYTLVMKGNTVVSIDPPGKNGPLYARANYRENQARWRKARRFVPEEDILW